jgi:hypothetical protein
MLAFTGTLTLLDRPTSLVLLLSGHFISESIFTCIQMGRPFSASASKNASYVPLVLEASDVQHNLMQ